MIPYRKVTAFTLGCLLLLLSHCIDDSYDDCRQGIRIYFHSITECQAAPSYPGEIENLTVCVFDRNGVLVSHFYREGIKLSADYYETVELDDGLYTVAAWSGLDQARFETAGLREGSTTMADLMFRLRRSDGGVALPIDGVRVYTGRSGEVEVVGTDSGDFFAETTVNMLEVTNRVAVSLTGENPGTYSVSLEADNGSMNIDGTIAADQTISYQSLTETDGENYLARFTILKLERGRTYELVVANSGTGKEIFRGDLLGELLLQNPNINLDCDHDFTVAFDLDEAYIITRITINGWVLHSFGQEF